MTHAYYSVVTDDIAMYHALMIKQRLTTITINVDDHDRQIIDMIKAHFDIASVSDAIDIALQEMLRVIDVGNYKIICDKVHDMETCHT